VIPDIHESFRPRTSSSEPPQSQQLQSKLIPSGGDMVNPIWAAVLMFSVTGCQNGNEKQVKLETQMDKVSYSIGLNIGNNMKRDSIKVNAEALVRGIMDATADSASRLMTPAQIQETMAAFQQDLQKRQEETARVAGEKCRVEGETYLAANSKKPGVVTLPSGLQYRVITQGTGKKPSDKSTVTVNYVGKLVDGTEFDSSIKRGQPATFPVNGVIKGWTDALQLMPVGSKWEIVIPSSLGYGESGAGNVIPPNSVLVFEVELLSIQ
jgi:FKBP-type peptidyl-prolyl cis-trans isomerase FklB